MINFFRKPNEKVFNLKELNSDTLLYKVFPRFFMELLKKYFRLEISGIENIPTKGPVIIAPNHSGFSGLDAMILSYIIQQNTKRHPKVMTHHLWFLTETTALPAHKLGLSISNLKPLFVLKTKYLNHLLNQFPHYFLL